MKLLQGRLQCWAEVAPAAHMASLPLNAVCCGPKGPKISSENTTFLKNTTLQKTHFTKHNSASQKTVTFQKTQQLYSVCFVKCRCVLTFRATVKSDTGSEMPQRGTDE